ncbi:hypothetical protein [Burkholderia pseudomallei]|uniref:hypothetical protein n=1 Tax=Burkholderia pseudomallei TaxID=28450 RepID=UPI000537E69C|nr:hypothetical protein [Burkholderia pseudomallei]KGV08976.1 hypothetical protein X895_2070 [Burkholderia pseudomallei MSHR4503]
MQVRVKLSSDPLIDFLDFSYAIADAVCPTGEKGLEGLDCVTGKLVTSHVPIPESAGKAFRQYGASWQSVLVSNDGRTLNELVSSDQAVVNEPAVGELPFHEPSPPQIGELTLPYELTDADREAFAKVLVDIKRPLRYPMSDEERAEFMEAYCKLPNRPMWMPALVTEETINRRKSEHDAVLLRHQRALLQEFEAGRLTPVNAYHAPVASLMAGTFIPRAQAVAYLERHGFAYQDREKEDDQLLAEQPSLEAEADTDHGKKEAAGKRKPRLTAEQCKQLLAYREELEAKKKRGEIKNPTRQTAERFGVSDSYVRRLVREAEAANFRSFPVAR